MTFFRGGGGGPMTSLSQTDWRLKISLTLLKMFIKSLHSIAASFIFFNLVYETRDNFGEL